MNLKGSEIVVRVVEQELGGKAIGYFDGKRVITNHGIPGQLLRINIKKVKQSYIEGTVVGVLEKSSVETENACPHFELCGGCSMQGVEYAEQVRLKEEQVKELFAEKEIKVTEWLSAVCSSRVYGYRNKMEFSFGNQYKDGPLTLGMHQRGRRFDVVDTPHCNIIDEDFRKIRETTAEYFRNTFLKPYHKISREGTLRHLVIRKGSHTGDILVNLVTTGDRALPVQEWKKQLLSLTLEGNVRGIVWTLNDGVADVVKSDELITLYGINTIKEFLMGLTFTITPFSFFQTNSFGAEDLYADVLGYIEKDDANVADLYCGLGTISQLVAKKATHVTGIELIEEAVSQAREDAEKNGFTNCQFIAGDVKDVLSNIFIDPDVIIVDPPRPGVHLKVMEDLLMMKPRKFIYVSCNPKTLVENLRQAQTQNWVITSARCIDLFPHTPHIEVVVLLENSIQYDYY